MPTQLDLFATEPAPPLGAPASSRPLQDSPAAIASLVSISQAPSPGPRASSPIPKESLQSPLPAVYTGSASTEAPPVEERDYCRIPYCPPPASDPDGHFAVRCGTCAAWANGRPPDGIYGQCTNPASAAYNKYAYADIGGINCPDHQPIPKGDNPSC